MKIIAKTDEDAHTGDVMVTLWRGNGCLGVMEIDEEAESSFAARQFLARNIRDAINKAYGRIL